MKIEIEWQQPILLSKNKRLINSENVLPHVPTGPGVYFFSRKFGLSFSPFYVGETMNLRGRIKSHLNNADIRDILRGITVPSVQIRQGNKFLHCGKFVAKRGLNAKRSLEVVQRYLIQRALADGSALLNKQLTVIRTHQVTFSGKKQGRAGYPRTLHVPI